MTLLTTVAKLLLVQQQWAALVAAGVQSYHIRDRAKYAIDVKALFDEMKQLEFQYQREQRGGSFAANMVGQQA